MIRHVALLLALLICAGARAQSPAPAPFLWQVSASGAGADTVHYLLGSVHMLPATAHPLPAALDRAYERTRVLVLESDLAALTLPELQAEVLAAALADEAGGVRNETGKDTYARVRARARSLGLHEGVCDHFRAWFCALTLEIAGFRQAGFLPEYGIDQHYHLRAIAEDRTVGWLEDPREHLALFTRMPAALGPAFLQATLDSAVDENGSPEALLRAWRDNDAAFIAARVEDLRATDAGAYARLLADRNRAWLDLLDGHFRAAEPALVVVGAAHLVGPDGLVEALRARGFKLTPPDIAAPDRP